MGGMVENSATIVAPLLLRNMLSTILIYADKSLFRIAEKYKLLQLIRYLLITSFLFFIRLFPSLISLSNSRILQANDHDNYLLNKPHQNDGVYGVCDSGIARALSQLLSSVTDIPVSSRKYEMVRSLAETVIEENNRGDIKALRELNRTVLSSAFYRTICQLESAMVELGKNNRAGLDRAGPDGPVQYRLNTVYRVVRSVGDGVWSRVGRAGREDVNRSGRSAEKLAAEMLWLAQKMVACGFEGEAVESWASASNLAWLSLSAEPRIQGFLVKVSAFLFKQSKDVGAVEKTEEGNKESLRQTKMKMLTSWLPLLCRGSNGSDEPVLSISERGEVEKVLEESIGMLEHEEQEQVLSLWLHHFTYCPSSDWPNLHASYARWCITSRNLFFLN